MREILFRGKRVYDGEWVKGNLFLPDKPDTPTQICIGTNIVRISYDVIPETVGQYIGLTDCTGKKIFEGDIVKDHESGLYGKVVFVTAQYGFDGMSGFMVDDINDGLQNYNGFWHMVSVIGNIYDNPELIGGDNNDM